MEEGEEQEEMWKRRDEFFRDAGFVDLGSRVQKIHPWISYVCVMIERTMNCILVSDRGIEHRTAFLRRGDEN